MFNIATVVFDRPSPPFLVQTLQDGTPQIQTLTYANKWLGTELICCSKWRQARISRRSEFSRKSLNRPISGHKRKLNFALWILNFDQPISLFYRFLIISLFLIHSLWNINMLRTFPTNFTLLLPIRCSSTGFVHSCKGSDLFR